MSTADRIILPLVGADPLTPEWYAARKTSIGASEAARALGISDYGQPLDVYLEKLGLVEPFEGNEFTERGKRAEPFIASEYTAQTGHEIETGLPVYYHGELKFLSATPDARWVENHKRLAEFKACNWRRAEKLGEPGTDEIFPDWLIQCQQQMFVMNAEQVDVFVMVDLHTYQLFHVFRNDRLIERMVPKLAELWQRIQDRRPPEPDFSRRDNLRLIEAMYASSEPAGLIELTAEHRGAWDRLEQLREQAKQIDQEQEEIKAQLLHALGTNECGKLPGGGELVRRAYAESYWTPADIDAAVANVGKVKRRGFVKLTARKTRGEK